MVIPLASRKLQLGISLVEILISSLIGVITLGIVGSLFFASLKISGYRGERLLLVDSLENTMLQIKQDIKLAGYNGDLGVVAKLEGSLNTVYVSSDNRALGYVYQLPSTEETEYRNVYFKYQAALSAQGGQLKLCEKQTTQPLDISLAAQSGPLGHCYNLFDPGLISIASFEVTTETIHGQKSARQLVSIRLVGYLKNAPEIHHSSEIKILIRNNSETAARFGNINRI